MRKLVPFQRFIVAVAGYPTVNTNTGASPGTKENQMGIGAGVFLIAVGAILTFALEKSVSGIDLNVVGVILMLAGALGIVADVAIFAPRRRTYRDSAVVAEPAYGSRTVVERERY